MIGYLQGKIKYKTEELLFIECNGVGYRVEVGEKTSGERVGKTIKLFIYTHVRENELKLFGFKSPSELELFEMLLDVSGVGPKVAMNLVSSLGEERVVNAILTKDGAGLKVSGVGIKTAKKIVLELGDKLKKKGFTVSSRGKRDIMRDRKFLRNLEEAKAALKSLGYSVSHVQKVIGQTKFSKKDEKKNVGELVKYFLSKM